MANRKLGLLPLVIEQPSENKKFFQAGNVQNVYYSTTTNITFLTKAIQNKSSISHVSILFVIKIIFIILILKETHKVRIELVKVKFFKLLER